MSFKFFEIQICSLLNNIIFVIQNVNPTTINLTNGTDAWRDYFLKDGDIFTGTFSQKRLNSKSIIYCFTWKWNRERTHHNFVARMIKYGRAGSLRHAHAGQLKDRLGALSLFELFWTANPSSETNGHRGICASGPGDRPWLRSWPRSSITDINTRAYVISRRGWAMFIVRADQSLRRGSTPNRFMISRNYPNPGTVARKNVPGHYWSSRFGVCLWQGYADGRGIGHCECDHEENPTVVEPMCVTVDKVLPIIFFLYTDC